MSAFDKTDFDDSILKVHLNTLEDWVNEYYQFVWRLDENTNESNIENYLMEDFKFSAANNWNGGFDFVDYLLGEGLMAEHYGAIAKIPSLDNLLSFKDTITIINRILKYYENDYGFPFDFFKDLTCEKILRQLVYVDLAEKSFTEMKEMFNVDDTTDPTTEFIKKI
jgi:hypothetical protein